MMRPYGPPPIPLANAVPAHSTAPRLDRKSTRLNSSHSQISYAVFCLKKKKKTEHHRASSLPTPNSSRLTNSDTKTSCNSYRSTLCYAGELKRMLRGDTAITV